MISRELARLRAVPLAFASTSAPASRRISTHSRSLFVTASISAVVLNSSDWWTSAPSRSSQRNTSWWRPWIA